MRRLFTAIALTIGLYVSSTIEGMAQSPVMQYCNTGQTGVVTFAPCPTVWTPSILNALLASATAIKTSPGTLGSLTCYNANAAVEYVQLFNLGTGGITVGTTAPYASIPFVASTTTTITLPFPGVVFSTAISAAATTTYNGSTAPGTALVCDAFYN